MLSESSPHWIKKLRSYTGTLLLKAVSAVTKAEKVESGTLIVRVDTPVWRQELHMQKEEILKKINKKIGTKAIRKIRFI